MDAKIKDQINLNLDLSTEERSVTIIDSQQEDESTTDTTITNLVRIENNQAVVSSREVAKHFEKEHKDVLKRIENIKAQNCAVTSMFYETGYTSGTGKFYKEYLMNRDGFSLLVMGFTGAKALDWKIRYIKEFNRMEEYIRQQQKPMMSNLDMFILAGKILKEHEQQLMKHENQINEIKDQINSPFIGLSFQQQLQDMQIQNHNKRIKGIEQRLTLRDYNWPDKDEARKLNNRIYRVAMRYKSLATEEEIQNLDDSFFISRIQQRLIADLKKQGRDILAELKEAQTYYYAKYMDVKLLSKTMPDYVLRPAEIKKLSLPKYLSTDTELIKAANLLLISYAEQATEI